MKAFKWYQYVRTGVPDLLWGSSVGGWRAAKREAQMAASSEHEFEGRVSGELSGEIFGWRYVHIQENPNDVTSSPQKQKSTSPRPGSDLKGITCTI